QRVQDGLTQQEAIKTRKLMMMKGTPHQLTSGAPLDEEQKENKGLTPENPKEEKAPVDKPPPLKVDTATTGLHQEEEVAEATGVVTSPNTEEARLHGFTHPADCCSSVPQTSIL
ncbi:hypothetical protein M9458_036402, partial [Cirrhinus mrigala]